MDDFIIFKFRDDLLEQISKSDIDSLSKFQQYGLTIKEIALVWMIKNNRTDENIISEFYDFHGLFEQSKEDYIKYYNGIAKDQSALEKEFNTFNKNIAKNKIDEYFQNDLVDFQESKAEMVIKYENISSLLPTLDIPMVRSVLDTNQGGVYIKLLKGYSDINELDDFFKSGEDESATHIFKIPSNEKGSIYSTKNQIVIPVGPKDESRIAALITKSFKLTGSKIYKKNINGELSISNSNFDWNVMAMLLVQKDFYDNKIFIAENGNVLSEKNKFILKYYKYGTDFSRPVFFSFSNNGNNIDIKISKIFVDTDIPIMISTILSVLKDYIEDEDDLINLYKKGLPTFKSIKKAKKTMEKQVKTKTRLEPLKKFDPEIFGGDYKTLCQGPLKQPRIPDKAQAKKLLKDAPEEIIEFPFDSGNYYTCAPFEKETKGKLNKYPGLLKKDDKYMPCCYPNSHHARPNSILNKYIAEQRGLITEVDKKISENILGKEKRLPPFRRGQLPDRLSIILKFIGLDPEKYLRYGMVQSHRSVINAMAAIYDYTNWTENYLDVEKQILKKLKSSSKLNAAAQSYTYDYLLDDGSRIDAAEFHPVVEYFFKSCVMVINGNNLARPACKFGFIPHLRKRKRLIILYLHPESQQVEIIGTYDHKFIITQQPVINKVLDIKRQCYGYFSPNKYTFPRIAEIANRASFQYVDDFGKNRGFIVDGQSIFLPPSAPLALPIVRDVHINDTKTIMKEFGIVGKWYKDNMIYSDDMSVPTDEVSDLSEPPDDYIRPFIISVSTFISGSQKEEIAANNKLIQPLVLDPVEIITIYPSDIEGYLKLIRKLPLFRWEKLENLEYQVDRIHWVIVGDKHFMVRDVPFKTVETKKNGTWSVVLGKKISSSGNYIEYPGEKYGIIL